jgi:predicted ATPase
MARKFILAGGPHAGKTTLLNGLRGRLPEAHFVPEPAELLIAEELRKAEQEPDYDPIVPTARYDAFVHRVMALSVELEAAVPADATVAILDRSMIDNHGYAVLNGRHDLVPSIQRLVRAAGYTAALFCNPVGTYTQTAVRPESPEYAHAIHMALTDAYNQSGVPVIEIPAIDIESRLDLVETTIRNF